MPKVPTYDNFQSQENTTPVVPMSDGGRTVLYESAMAGQQMQTLAHGMEQAGSTASDLAVDMQNVTNQVRVNDALNQAKQAALNLTYDPNQGYKNLKGDAALTRPDGKALPDEYGEKLQQTVSGISDNLGNDAQRLMFNQQSSNLLTSFRGDVESHMLGEFRNYALSTQEGTVKLGVDTAKLNWNNPDKINQALDSVKAAIWQAGALQGQAGALTDAKIKVATSGVHVGGIDAALQNNKPEYALAYLNSNKDGMTADDILRVRGVLDKDLNARIADGTATNVVNGFRMQIQPSDLDRMTNITMQSESGGNPNAVSPKGAKGVMQVMDATNAAPGFGVAPAKDNSPEERARVGRDYLAAMVQKYGDPAKAWAAYNAGPGALDAAMSQAKDGNWLALMPKETQDYVAKNVTALNAGGGAPARPTLLDVHDQIRAKLGPNPNPSVLKQALDSGTKQFNDLNRALASQADNTVMQAQQWLAANGGDFTKLPSNLRAAVVQNAPGKLDDLMKYAKAIATPVTTTNMGAYNYAMENPEQLAQMSQSEFAHFQTIIFDTATQKQIENLRAYQLNGKTDNSAGMLNNAVFNSTVNNRIASIGIVKPDVKDKNGVNAYNDQVGSIKKFLADDILAQQQQLGRKMTQDEMIKRIDQTITTDVNFRHYTDFGLFQMQGSVTPAKLFSLNVSDIPAPTMTKMKQDFASRGITNPTNDQLRRYYWFTKSKGN